AAGFCPDVDDGIADSLRFREKNFFFARDAERERVDERILRVARLETDFAADRRHAETIAVEADTANDAIETAAILSSVFIRGVVACRDFTEAERIENRDRSRAHGKNVAQDSADAGGRALEWFDVARMIVRFDFERGN